MLPIVKFEKKSRTGPCGPHGCEEEKRQRKSGREPRVEVKVGKGFLSKIPKFVIVFQLSYFYILLSFKTFFEEN